MLIATRVEIERGGIGDVSACVIRDDSNVVAYLTLVRVAFERVKRAAHRNVTRPCDTSIGAKRVEQL